MQRFQNTYTAGMSPRPAAGDWQAEINGGGMSGMSDPHAPAPGYGQSAAAEYAATPGGQMITMGNMPGMRSDLPEDMIQNPVSVEEAHKGSIKGMLSRNEGNYVVATFLVGTQGNSL